MYDNARFKILVRLHLHDRSCSLQIILYFVVNYILYSIKQKISQVYILTSIIENKPISVFNLTILQNIYFKNL